MHQENTIYHILVMIIATTFKVLSDGKFDFTLTAFRVFTCMGNHFINVVFTAPVRLTLPILQCFLRDLYSSVCKLDSFSHCVADQVNEFVDHVFGVSDGELDLSRSGLHLVTLEFQFVKLDFEHFVPREVFTFLSVEHLVSNCLLLLKNLLKLIVRFFVDALHGSF